MLSFENSRGSPKKTDVFFGEEERFRRNGRFIVHGKTASAEKISTTSRSSVLEEIIAHLGLFRYTKSSASAELFVVCRGVH